MRPQGIIYAGAVWPLTIPDGMPGAGEPIPVYTWLDQSVRVPEFKPGDGYNKRRVVPIDLGVYHWTGGEGSPLVMAETLRKRKLGVEFAIDGRTGAVFQFCDPALVDTADSGFLNNRSYGVEVVSYGYSAPLKMRHLLVPKGGRDRAQEEVVYRGKLRRIACFRQPQIASAVAISIAMTRAAKVSPVVLEGEHGDVELGLVGRPRLDAFKGVLGHYHFDEDKLDPGPTLLRAIQAGLRHEFPEGLAA